MTLPKPMRFKPPKASDWFAEYAWVAFPESAMAAQQPMNADLADVGKGANTKENRSAAANSTARQKSNLRQRSGSTAGKSVKFITDNNEEQKETGGAVGVTKKSAPSEGGPASAKKQQAGGLTRPKSAVNGKGKAAIPKPTAGKTAKGKDEGASKDTS